MSTKLVEILLVAFVLICCAPALLEDLRDKAEEKATPFRQGVARVCNGLLVVFNGLAVVTFGAPILALVIGWLALVAWVIYRAFLGVASMPTSIAVLVGAVIIAMAIRRDRHRVPKT